MEAKGPALAAGDIADAGPAVDKERRTSVPGVWAGSDCVAGGQDLTVAAVEDGKLAALSIDKSFKSTAKQ